MNAIKIISEPQVNYPKNQRSAIGDYKNETIHFHS